MMLRRLRLPAWLCASAASLYAVHLGSAAAHVANSLTLLAIGALLIRGPRRRDDLDLTRRLLLAALGIGLVASLSIVVYAEITGHGPARPWPGDGLELLYVPLTVAGLLLVPAAPQRPGYRLRATADGLLAGTSVWFLVAAVARPTFGLHFGVSGIGRAVALAYAAGDITILATALTVLSRCALPLTRVVGWIATGLAAMASGDLWVLLTSGSPYAIGPVLLLQSGLLLLLLAAWIPSPQAREEAGTSVTRRAVALAPFLPLLVGIGLTARLVAGGQPMRAAQVLPALLVAVSLLARQYASSREKQRLVDQLRQREVGLQAALRRDELTGLGNRLALMERLSRVLRDRRQWPVTVAVLDLDDFKVINDSHGHSVGDEVLRQAAGRIARAVRSDDLVVRLGGDEFAVVAGGIDATYREVLAQRLLGVFDEPVVACEEQFRISPSVGIVVGRPPQTAEELLAHADAAMYRAKEDRAGGGKVTVLDEAERRQIMRQLRIRREIAEPDLDQFDVVYQPVVELATGEIRGFEALLRWTHPELGTVPPSVFVPLAEQSGSIGELGQFVLERAIGDLARLQWSVRDRRLFVGVNVSPRQLARADFVKSTQAVLAANGLRPWQLMLEITEHAFAKNLKPIEEAVTRLSAAEIAIAIDDFGTGYSTLHYLERLQPSVMKIDRSFISGDTIAESSRRLVASLITMAKALGLRLIAEGIETPEQLEFLREAGCGLGQGYLFSRPVELDQMERLLRLQPLEPVDPGEPDGGHTADSAVARRPENLSSSGVFLPQPYPSSRAGQG